MDAYLAAIVSVMLIYVVLALGLTLQYGLTGLINFGLVGFFAIGAYTSALLALHGLPVVLSVACAAVVSGLAAWPIGLASLRLRDDYFAIVTLGFAEIVRLALTSEKWLTNGVQGLSRIPPVYEGTGTAAALVIVAIFLAVTVAAIALIHRVAHSPFGRIIAAIRDNEEAVQAIGKDPARFKIQVLIVGSALAGVAGALYAHYVTYIVPEQFVALATFYVWMAVIMGGVGRVSGAVVGTAILMFFLEGSRFLGDFLPWISSVQMASIRIGVVGLALVLFTIYRPQGLMGDFTKR